MAPDVRTARADRGSPGRLLHWDVFVGLLLVLVLLAGSAGSPGFASAGNLSFALGDLGEIALIALAMTMLVVAAEVDLSVASVLGLSSALLGALWDAGWAIETIIPLVVAVGAVCGLVNGLLVTRLGLPSLAVTIGTLALYRGLAYVVLGDRAIAEFPRGYTEPAVGDVPGTPIPYPVALFVLLAAVTGVVLHATGFGRSLFAGVLLIGLIRNLLMLNDVATEIQSIVTGLLLIISVITPRLLTVFARRRRAPAHDTPVPPAPAHDTPASPASAHDTSASSPVPPAPS
ncbi:ABC transporter permease [Streptosporangium sp. DT93]|uniref:ABC transporter permease n=1 Tax=Streptosporangium sp. DT93 TaxID=3393428 RepID=UPI003CE92171